MQTDIETGSLCSFIATTVDHISRDCKTYCLELKQDGDVANNTMSITQKMVEPNTKSSYIQHREGELPQIQTVHKTEEEYRVSFYVDREAEIEDESLSKAENAAKKALSKTKGAMSFREAAPPQIEEPYKLLKTYRMTRETHAVTQEMLLSKSKTNFYGAFLDRDSSSVNWFHEDLRKEKVGDGY